MMVEKRDLALPVYTELGCIAFSFPGESWWNVVAEVGSAQSKATCWMENMAKAKKTNSVIKHLWVKKTSEQDMCYTRDEH